jgi:hypothetical protein
VKKTELALSGLKLFQYTLYYKQRRTTSATSHFFHSYVYLLLLLLLRVIDLDMKTLYWTTHFFLRRSSST